MAWENRIVEQGEKPADQFQANPLNYRTHPFKQRQATKASLDTLGWIDRVKVNRRPNGEEILLDGHDRVWQALQNGNALVPYEIVELSENEEKIALAVFDPITEMAEVDTEILEQLLSEVNTTNADMQALLADLAEAEGVVGGEFEPTLPSEEGAQELKPYTATHVLLSLSLEKMAEVKPLIDAIESLGGVDVNYASN